MRRARILVASASVRVSQRMALFLAAALVAGLVPGALGHASLAHSSVTHANRAGKIAPSKSKIRDLHNRARENQLVKKLKKQKCAQRYAQAHAKRLAKKTHALVHSDLTRLLKTCGYRLAGENIAYSHSSAGKRAFSEKRIHSGWMNSPLHRANILKQQFRKIGIGVSYDKPRKTWYYVVVFGRR